MIRSTSGKILIFLSPVLLSLLIYGLWYYGQPLKPNSQNMEQAFAKLYDSLEYQLTHLTHEDSLMIVDSTAQKILFIGDSMAKGIKLHLKKYADFNGHTLITEAKRSATIISWVGDPQKGKLRSLIEEVNPTYIIICLGSNELFTRSLERYRGFLQNILKQSHPYKLAWISPPNWKRDNGLSQVIESEISYDRVFPSQEQDLIRAGDGIHPTYKAYRQWTDSIANWLMTRSRHKIVMLNPDADRISLSSHTPF